MKTIKSLIAATALFAAAGAAQAEPVSYNLHAVPSAQLLGDVAATLKSRLSHDMVDPCVNLVIAPFHGNGGHQSALTCTPTGDGALLHGFALDRASAVSPYLVYVTRGSIMSMPPARGPGVAITGADTERIMVMRVEMRLAEEIELGSAALARHAVSMLSYQPGSIATAAN